MIATVKRTRKTKSFTSNEVSQIVSMMADDDAELLELAKSRRNEKDREFTGVDEFINFLEK